MKIYFTAWDKRGMKKTWKKPTARRIKVAIASDKYETYHLKTEYGKAKCSNGCICTPHNDIKGNRDDIVWAVRAFIEEYENTY